MINIHGLKQESSQQLKLFLVDEWIVTHLILKIGKSSAQLELNCIGLKERPLSTPVARIQLNICNKN